MCPSAVRSVEGLARVRFRFKVLGGELGGFMVTAGESDGKAVGPVGRDLCRGLGGGAKFMTPFETGVRRLV